MLLVPEISPVDGPLHRQNLAFLNALAASPDQNSLRLALVNVLVEGDVVTLLPSAGVLTKTFFVKNDLLKQLTIVIGGMDNTFAQVSSCLQSWSAASSGPNSYNTYLQAAKQIVNSILSIIQPGYENVRIIGHSYGGAVAMHLPGALNNVLLNNGSKQVYTYGAPKADTEVNGLQGRGFDFRRCYQNTDPVPSLPLGSGDVGSLWVYVGVPTARLWNRWTQGVSGLGFDNQGHLLAGSNPTITATPTLFYLSLASWLTGINCFAADAHSLASYTQAAGILLAAPTFTAAPQTYQAIRGPILTVPQVRRQRDEEIALLAVNTDANLHDTAIGIQSGITIVAGTRYRGAKIGGTNYVLYGDTVVVPTRTLRSRRSLVRYLNRTL